MSIFRTISLDCPKCATPVVFELVHSVNADRRPDLRAAIVDRSFQSQPCPACGHRFRVEPEFTYQDLARGQFFLVWPAGDRQHAGEREERTRSSFDRSWGASAPPEAREIGGRLRCRCIFGWAALSEKLLADEHGIDDRTLELLKFGMLRNESELSLAADRELRLVSVSEETLGIGWIRTASDTLIDLMEVPRSALAEIEADAEDWAALRADIGDGPYVDIDRLLITA